MPDDTTRQTRQLVLLGGGHAHVAVLKAFGKQRLPEVRLVLVSTLWDTPYSGMLPAMIAGHYSRDDIHVDLHRLCRHAGGDFYRDRVVGLELAARKVLLAGHPPVHFDLLSINTGSTPARTTVPGANEFAIPVKPIEQLIDRLCDVEQRFLAVEGRPFRVVTVGGGAGGVELTLSLQHRLWQLASTHGINARSIEFTLITASSTILEDHNRRVQSRFEMVLAERGVKLVVANPAVEVTATKVICQNGTLVHFDALFWATNAAAPDWPCKAGLAVDERGFIAVNNRLQSTSHEYIYAAGDVATMVKNPRPKSGVFAVRQGPPLARNLRLALMGFTPKPYHPQRTSLSLISTGDQQAVASKGSFAASGHLLWRWKQRIDQKWMRQYQKLPVVSESETEMDFTSRMKGNPHTGDKPTAGRLAKSRQTGVRQISALILHEALKQFQLPPNSSVVVGLDAFQDAAVISPPTGQLIVQGVSHLRSMINDPWLFGRIAVNHALNKVHALGATPLVGQATVTIESAADRIMIERLGHLLAGVATQLAAANANLAGGHLTEGGETGLGLSITGTVAGRRWFRKFGLRPGNQLILTKPLGTGVLLAADQAGKLSARVLKEMIDGMLQSNSPAVEIFRRAGVTTCTDVAAFGLLGNLREMMVGTDVRIEIWPSRIPALSDVMEILKDGMENIMATVNAHNLNLLSAEATSQDVPEIRLLLDPQISGPLLAAVPSESEAAILEQLHSAGFNQAVSVGKVVEGGSARPILVANPAAK